MPNSRPALPQGIVQRGQRIHRRMQLPAELAHIAHAQRAHRHAGDANFAAAQPGEGVVAEIRVGQPLQQLARTRPAHDEHAALLGDIVDVHRLARQHDSA